MKKRYSAFLILLCLLPALAACGKGYDYTAHISEACSDIFRAETDAFTVTLSCISREHPFASDGIACPKTDVVEISIVPVAAQITDYSVFVSDKDGEWGGEASFRSAFGDWFYSESHTFPEESVSLRIEWGEEKQEITATSVKNEATLSVEDALSFAVSAEQEYIGRMMQGGNFMGEFRVCLLRRDKNYYYVGIVDREKRTLSLLLDSESGEVLARREAP